MLPGISKVSLDNVLESVLDVEVQVDAGEEASVKNLGVLVLPVDHLGKVVPLLVGAQGDLRLGLKNFGPLNLGRGVIFRVRSRLARCW